MNYQEFKEQFHIQLNPQQEEAVQAVDGSCLLLAVPGSGKTTVLVHRLGYMLYGKHIPPERILVLTYTVAATRDMAERFYRVFGEEYRGRLEFRTINGICAKIILYFSQKIGKSSYALETDESVRKRRLTNLYREAKKEYPTESEIKDVSTMITYIKNMMLTDEEIQKLEKNVDYPLYSIYKQYVEGMKQDQKMDYDDQMIYAYNILKCSPETLTYFQELYPYICVDEAQDTSKIQHVLIAMLAGEKDNLFMVGDEDQSIYGWRAAYPEALLHFEQEHKGAKVLLMETNYRSNARIVEAANGFIQKNKLRHKKTLMASRPAGVDVHRVTVNGRKGQYDHILQVAKTAKEETAFLYRDNESMIPIVDIFERNRIPFRMKQTELTFFSHRITVDITAFLRFALNPRDVESFMLIYYKTGMFMAKADAEKLCDIAARKGVDILEAGRQLEDHFRAGEKFQTFIRHIYTLKKLSPDTSLEYILTVLGYEKYLKNRKISPNKLDILKDIASRCQSNVEFLARLDELKVLIENASPDIDSPLILSTIHSSKGLEYEKVYLLDVIDDIFPESIPKRKCSEEEWARYEEERRIFYVGATRAKDELTMFLIPGMPSRFISEFRVEPEKPKVKQEGFSFSFT